MNVISTTSFAALFIFGIINLILVQQYPETWLKKIFCNIMKLIKKLSNNDKVNNIPSNAEHYNDISPESIKNMKKDVTKPTLLFTFITGVCSLISIIFLIIKKKNNKKLFNEIKKRIYNTSSSQQLNNQSNQKHLA